MKKIACFSAAVLLFQVGFAEETVPQSAPLTTVVDTSFELPWSTRIITGASFGNENEDGYLQVLAPIWAEGETMIYVNPQMALSSDTDPGFSFGVGIRRYVPEWDAIVGGNMFYDRYASVYDNYFNQLGLGFEILTERVDFRFNYYLPEGGAQAASFVTSTGATRQSTTFGTPFATQNTVFQQQTNLTQTGKLNRTFEGTEAAMEGYDVEVGFLVPLFQEIGETRLYGGFYGFDNTFGDDFVGAKARGELRLSSKLILETNYFEDTSLYGDNWTFGFRVNMPIESGPGGLRKMFSGILGGSDESQKRPSSLAVSRNVPASFSSSLFDRMGEQTIRNSFVQTSDSGFTENVGKRNFVVEEETQTTQTNVVSDSVVFVGDPNAARGAATAAFSVGTFEDPVPTIQEGINLAAANFGNDGNVVVSGELSNYSEDVDDAGSSVRIWGGGEGGLPGQGGKTLPYFGTPSIAGEMDIDDINTFSVSGFNFVGTGGGLDIDDVSNVTVVQNTFMNDDTGVELSMPSGTFSISNNEFLSNGDDGIFLTFDDGSVVNGVIANNLFKEVDDGALEIEVEDAETNAKLDVIGNQFVENDYAFYLDATDMDEADQTLEINLRDNVFTDNDSTIEVLYSDMDSDGSFTVKLDFHVIGNKFIGNNNDDIYVDIGADSDGDDTVYDFNFLIRGNTFENTSDDALIVEIDDDFDGAETLLSIDIDVLENTFKNIGSSAVDVVIDDNDFEGGFDFEIDIVGNQILTTGDTALLVDVDDIDADGDVSDFSGVIASNQISDVDGNAIEVLIDGFTNTSSLTIGDNTISGVTGTGILVEGDNTPFGDGIFGNNLVSDTGDDFDISDVDGTILINGVERP